MVRVRTDDRVRRRSGPCLTRSTTTSARCAVHPRRRKRIIDEIESHLRESEQRHGVAQAIARIGPPAEVARSFTPGALDRIWQQRDRFAALTMLAAMIGSLPLALEVWKLNDNVGRSTWLYSACLAPTAVVAVISAALTLVRRPARRRLVAPLAVLVAVTAVVTLLDLPFSGSGQESAGSLGTASLNP